MQNKLLIILAVTFFLSGCITVAPENVTPTAPLFVTSTLPPTDTPRPSPTVPPPTSAPTLSVTALPNCTDKAILLQDVTITDGTNVPRGTKFTKTWQFKNSGNCPWINYKIAFVSGDRMSAPDTSPVPDTPAGKTVNISVDLVAPTTDGAYTGFFELRDALGQPLAIGIEKTFWVKITVGTVVVPPTLIPGTPGTPGVFPTGRPGSCAYSQNGGYLSQIASLINSARVSAGLSQLSLNDQLAAAAQGHSTDMACNSLLSHNGSDGSTPYQRIMAAGYSGTYTNEIIYAGGTADDAFNWWMGDQIHHDAIMNPSSTEMGIGYAYYSGSAYGGYFTVDFGAR
jgi:uncharacterized protein YkwD